MKKIILATALAVASGVLFAAPPKDFAQRVERARTTVGVPGMAVAILEGDTVTFAKGFGVNGSAMISPDMSPDHTMLHQVTTFTATPKYDMTWFGAYLPLSVDVMGNVSLGMTLRAGPLIIGTADLLGFFAKKYVYNADIHAALKVTIPYTAKTKKQKTKLDNISCFYKKA